MHPDWLTCPSSETTPATDAGAPGVGSCVLVVRSGQPVRATVGIDSTCPPFTLIECLRYAPFDGLRYLDQHLSRLARSARYFRFHFDEHCLRSHLTRINTGSPAKVRVALSPSGEIRIDLTALPALTRSPLVVAIDTHPVRSDDIFMRHKTSNRDNYRAARARFPGVDDVIMVNERGEITEGTIANIAALIEDKWWTPPLSSGCLPGVERSIAISKGQLHERILQIDQLLRADGLALLSSVRGWRTAQVLKPRAPLPERCSTT